MRPSSLLVPLALLSLAGCRGGDRDTGADTGTPWDPSGWPLGTVVATDGRGLLAELETSQGTLYVLRLQGDWGEMGRQAGTLLGERIGTLLDGLVGALAEEAGMDADTLEELFSPLLRGIWDGMEPYISPELLELVYGVEEGMGEDPEERCSVCEVIALTNVSDLNAETLTDLASTASRGESEQLETYYDEGPDAAAGLEPVPVGGFHPFGGTCSFFAAWGERTEGGHLLASRNLDWNADTGIADGRLLTIFQPEDGHPFATFGYFGMIGALAGMSSTGIAVSEVGSTGVLERLRGTPWTLRHVEILAHAEDLDEALAYHENLVPDGFNRPQTIGYNFMVAWGDPEGGGAGAEGAVVEANGAVVSVHRGGAGGSIEVHLLAEDGTNQQVLGPGDELVVPEAEAVEIDAAGQARLFAVDEEGNFLLDEDGDYVEDPEGQPLPTGRPLEQALYRGDEAFSYWNRRYQVAAHGPQDGDGTGLMVESGSYRHRYTPSHDILEAYATGGGYVDEDGVEVVPPGEAVPLGMDEAEVLARYVAMDSDILSVVYDATALVVRLSYESGTGDDWLSAADQPQYVEIELGPAFEYP